MPSTIPFTQSPGSGSGLHYARYVGRVGALAVALGVGFAAASTQGVAHASPSSEAPAPSNTSDSSNSSAAPQNSNGPSEQRLGRKHDLHRAVGLLGAGSRNRDRSTSERQTTGNVDGAAENAKGQDSRVDRDSLSGNIIGHDTRTVSAGSTRRGGQRIPSIRRSSKDAQEDASSRRVVVETTPRRFAPVAAADPGTPRVRERVEAVVRSQVQPSTVRAAVDSRKAPVTLRVSPPAAQTTLSSQRAPDPIAPAPTRSATFVTGVLSALGLAPSITPTRTPAPAPVPFTWAVLGFVRRELEQVQRTFLNRTPVVTSDTIELSEDVDPTVIRPLVNDKDPDRGDTLRIVNVTPPAGADGTLVIDRETGTTLTYTPGLRAQALDDGESLTETFQYTVSDAGSAPHIHGLVGLLTGGGHTSTGSITIVVNGVNDAPTVAGVVAAIDEDADLTGTLPGGSDVDGDALKYVLTGAAPEHGTVSITDTGSYTYVPDLNYNGPDTFSFVVNDGTVDSAPATVAITVRPVNDNPVANADPLSISENAGTSAINVVSNDTDVDGDSLRVTAVAQSTQPTPLGTAALAADGTVTFTPNAAALALNTGQTATDSFTYTVSDGHGGSAVGTVNVTVTGVSNGTAVSTPDGIPVDVEWGTNRDRGIIRYEDGTWAEVDYSDTDGWTVGAGVDYGFDSGEIALDGRTAYAYDLDGSVAVVDLDTAAVDRVTDASGLEYRFGAVTDVAVDSRADAGQVRRVYTVDSAGAVVAIDPDSRTVVGRQETGLREVEFLSAAAADTTATSASPKLAVARGGDTIYVANGGRIAVVKRQTAVAMRVADEGDAAAAANELVYDDSLDITLRDGGQITALETGGDGTLYATVVGTNTSTSGARLVRIAVDAETGVLAERESVVLGAGATSLAISDDLDRAYVGSAADRNVSVVGLRRLDVLDVVNTGIAADVAVAPGRNTILVTNPGARAISLVSEAAVTTDAPISIALTWGSQPQDLDSHLLGATDDGTFHVSYVDRTWRIGDQVGAFLDVDDTNGNGPEVITLNNLSPGTYVYYVDNFSNNNQLIGSGATVTITDRSTGQTLGHFDVPARGLNDDGTERYWSVFTITIDDEGTATISPVTGDPLTSAVPTLPAAPSSGSAVYL